MMWKPKCLVSDTTFPFWAHLNAQPVIAKEIENRKAKIVGHDRKRSVIQVGAGLNSPNSRPQRLSNTME
eukprot:1160376-Pelagomonas_calceolata.AAC.2